jgi:hypothetical protein
MNVSKFLSKVIGMYFIIISIAMLSNMNQFINQMNGLIHDEPLIFTTGFFTLILGILLVVSHNIWQWNWRVIITIIAWITLIKGVSIILCPQMMSNITMFFVSHVVVIYIAAVIDFILGVLLCYYGFKRK